MGLRAKSSEGEVSQDLEGHIPLLLICHATPVKPSLRTQSWGDVVPPWDDGVDDDDDDDDDERMYFNVA